MISGYLITPRIIGPNGLQLGHKNLRKTRTLNFFLSRFLRLAPAATFALLVTSILMFLFEPPREFGRFASLALSYQLLGGNFGAGLFAGDYFYPNPNPLLHLWSLSTEEQFYLIIPIVIYLSTIGFRSIEEIRRRERLTLGLIGAISFLSFLAIRAIEEKFLHTPEWLSLFNFYSPTSRLWEFCFGSVAYFYSREKIKSKWDSFIFTSTLSTLIFIVIGSQLRLGIGIELGVVFLTAIALHFKNDKFRRIQEPLSKVGDISYSLYLIHLPVLYIAFFSPVFGESLTRKLPKVFAVVLCFLIAIPMTYLIENRYRYLNNTNSRITKRTFLGIFLKFQVLPTICLVAIVISSQYSYFGLDRNSKAIPSPLKLDEKCFSSDRTTPCSPAFRGSRDALLIGDSHAEHLSIAFQRAAIVMNITPLIWVKNGCQFVLPQTAPKVKFEDLWRAWDMKHVSESESCFGHNLQILRYVKENPGIRIFVTHRSTAYPVHDFHVSSSEWNSLIIRNLVILKQNGGKVTLVGPNPEFPDYSKFFMGQTMFWQKNYEDSAKHVYSINEMNPTPQLDDQTLKTGLAMNGVGYVSTISTFCNSSVCSRYAGGEWLYTNADHLSLKGSLLLIPKLKSSF